MRSKPPGELQLSPVVCTDNEVYQCYLKHTHLHSQYSWEQIKKEELLFNILQKHAKRFYNGKGGNNGIEK